MNMEMQSLSLFMGCGHESPAKDFFCQQVCMLTRQSHVVLSKLSPVYHAVVGYIFFLVARLLSLPRVHFVTLDLNTRNIKP